MLCFNTCIILCTIIYPRVNEEENTVSMGTVLVLLSQLVTMKNASVRDYEDL